MTIKIPDSRPKFKRPPIIEVAATIHFEALDPEVLAIHLGDIWDEIGDEYVEVEFKNQMPDVVEGRIKLEEISTDTKFNFPKYWFKTSDDSDLLQLYHNRLTFNWRRLNDEDKSRYTSFEHVWGNLAKAFSALDGFLKAIDEPPLKPTSCELAYFNSIPFDSFGGSLASVSKLYPSQSWLSQLDWLDQPNAFNFIWNIPNVAASRNLSIQSVTAVSTQTGDPILRLDLHARGNLTGSQNLDSVKTWFNDSHLIIVNTFVGLTSEEIRKEVWQQYE